MTDLDPEVMKIFTKAYSKTALAARKKSGIDKIFPSMDIDDFLFDPCGYSMNGILKNVSTYTSSIADRPSKRLILHSLQDKLDYGLGEYMTIHITPEPEFSYVSFETNVPLPTYLDLIKTVLDLFLPGKFTLTVFANRVRSTQTRFLTAWPSVFNLTFAPRRHQWQPIATRSCNCASNTEIGSGRTSATARCKTMNSPTPTLSTTSFHPEALRRLGQALGRYS